jgi:RNA polymerase sigma-70 factor (ECF subfamily)
VARSSAAAEQWLAAFHAGDRATLEACYREHFAAVDRAIGSLLTGADRETVIHEVFWRVLAREEFRRSFQGGAFASWLMTVARHQAIDFRRRLDRETSLPPDGAPTASPAGWEQAAHARLLVEQFRREVLPSEWQGVFELRFLQQLPQRAAADQLSIGRTTLAYREMRIRRLLKHFLLEGDPPR